MDDQFEDFEAPDADHKWTVEDLIDRVADAISDDPVSVDMDAPDSDRNRLAVQIGKARFHITITQVAP